jgi:hypothetical protein
MYLKFKILIAALVIFCVNGYSQCYDCRDSVQTEIDSTRIVRNFIGFVPSKADVINGWAVGYLIGLGIGLEDSDSVTINGLHTDIGPIQALMTCFVVGTVAVMVLPETCKALFKKDRRDTIKSEPDTIVHLRSMKHRLNGVSVGLMDFENEFSIQGLQVAVVLQKSGRLKGLGLAGAFGGYDELKGVMIAGLGNATGVGSGVQIAPFNLGTHFSGFQIGMINISREMKGLQIGLVNSSKRMKGVQIGLWNRIGKRGFPLLNFRFR